MSYHKSLQRVTISRWSDLPQLAQTSYHNSLKRVIATHQKQIQQKYFPLAHSRLPISPKGITNFLMLSMAIYIKNKAPYSEPR